MKILTMFFVVTIVSSILFSCGGGSGGDGGSNAYNNNAPVYNAPVYNDPVYNDPVSEPTPIKITSTVNGKIYSSLPSNAYIVAVSFNKFKLPVRDLEPINSDGSFTMELDKNKEYVFFIQNDKNEFITALTDGQNNIGLTFSEDTTNIEFSYNGNLFEVINNDTASIVNKTLFNKDSDNDNIPFFADFTEINDYFGYKVYFDDFSQNSMSYSIFDDYSWNYMYYDANLHSISDLGITAGRNTDMPLFFDDIYCVSVERKLGITKADRKIHGKIFKRIEGFIPIYIRNDVDSETRQTLLEAINKWNNAFKEIGIDNQIQLYYAGEVVENKYFYNAISNDWRGIYIYTIENGNTLTAGKSVDMQYWNDIDSSFKLTNVKSAILRPNLYPINEWKPRVDELVKLYNDGTFYVEYTTDSNGNLDYGAVITNIGKPMKAIVINSFYKDWSIDYEQAIIHEIGHTLFLHHPFYYDDTNYIYYNDLKGKESVMNYIGYYQDYPGSYEITQFDKDVLKYVYDFSTSEEITFDNISVFLKQKCGL